MGLDPIDWANKSFAISASPAVQYCVGTDTGCWYVVRERLVAAGVRLGDLLSRALGELQAN